jgi:NADH dehydrogenase [ubiquinone] 1 alpha subcomplex assembly factor 7
VTVSEPVAERIRTAIREGGPITFDRYMAHALYGPGGFYEGSPVGERGHFVTSPHVHPVFSRLVGAALEQLWECLGRPVPFRLIEAGAGDGTMGRELVAGFERGGIELRYVAVETSPGARAALAAAGLPNVARLADLEPIDPGVVVANELLDNLPFRRVRSDGGEVVELLVGLDGGRFVEIAIACPAELAKLAPALRDGEQAAVPVGALAFVDELADRLRSGYALLVDYAAGTPGGAEAHAYRNHGVLEDVLEAPGSADITAGVDIEAVAARARERGLIAFRTVRQADALRALGLDDWLLAERSRQGDLLSAGRGSEAASAWDGRNRASLLTDRAALGRLRWLLLATPSLSEPDWLAEAASFQPPEV